MGDEGSRGGDEMRSVEDVNLMDPATQENWYPAYDILREQAPCYSMPQLDLHVLTRYEDIMTILRRPEDFTVGRSDATDHQLFKFEKPQRIFEEQGWSRTMPLGMDPPDHRGYRKLIDPYFNAPGARKVEPMIRRITSELVDDFASAGHSEFVSQFATPLPTRIITLMLGFPLEDIPDLKRWSEAWVMPFAEGLSEEEEIYSVEQSVAFQHYIMEAITARRKEPRDDIISRLTTAEFEGRRPVTDEEIINMIDHLYIGGNETTAFAISSGMYLLIQNPDVYEELQADRSKIGTFVEEVLRLESPTQGLYRQAQVDIEFHGVQIAKGEMIHIRFAAANRDPRMFPNPEKLDLSRKNAARQMAFSFGEHTCPGAGLSRLEQVVAWEILLDRLEALRFTPGKNDFKHLPGFVLRGLSELHISFEERS
jgi:cytochrome P450